MAEASKRFRANAWTCGLLLAGAAVAAAQTVTPVPKLDTDRFVSPWHEIARYPIKKEKACLSDEVVLYALGDKKDSFQRVTSCKIKGGNSEFWNATGKLDKGGSGMLKVRTIWPFSTKYWVIATAPDYGWIAVGTPNHKSLWILAKEPAMSAQVLSDVEPEAAAQGFNTAKLIKIEQQP